MYIAMFHSVLSQLQVKLQQQIKPRRRPKIHDYTQDEWGSNYIFEAIEGGNRGYMTGQGQGIKLGDYVLLSDQTSPCQYQVEKIDYYSNQPDIWIALLKNVSI